jgi:diguanylate cyclase (GGDEF)-like protein
MVDTSDLIDRDDLTGFFLRKAFMPFFKKLVIQTGQGKKNLTIVHIDIDKFKRFNDKYGHYFGDLILKYVGSTLELSLRDVEHYTFRYGGDEFVIAFPG